MAKAQFRRRGAVTMETAPYNVTRAALVGLTRERTGLSTEESRKVVQTILQIVEDRLRAGERIKISGFGTFTVKRKHSRRGRNPKTGGAIIIHSRRVLSFKASQVLKDLVNERSSGAISGSSHGIRPSSQAQDQK
jgi:integration host factor subunit alpha